MQTQRRQIQPIDLAELDPRAVEAARMIASSTDKATLVAPGPSRGLLGSKSADELKAPKVAYLASLRMDRSAEGLKGIPKRVAALGELAIVGVNPANREALSEGGIVDQAIALVEEGVVGAPSGSTGDAITFERDSLPPIDQP